MEMENNLTLGSLFDGSGGFPLAAINVGITPLWSSEIEPFPIRVTTKNLPTVKHLGDIHDIHGDEIAPVDIITFGSPCQNLSIAGKREGLEGDRSSLFYEAIRIIKEMRWKTNGKYPRYAVWENVPGAFSSNKGLDFKAVLDAFAKVKDEAISVPLHTKWPKAGLIMGDDYSICYRTLDAQHFGVPQRRKRIFLVADFNGRCAGKILFEPKSLPRNIKSCNEQRENSPACSCESATDASADLILFENHSQDTRYKELDEVAPTVSANYGLGGNNQPFVVSAFDIRQTSDGTKNERNNVYETDTARTIDTSGNIPHSNQGGVAVIQGSMIGRKDCNGPQGDGINEDVSFTLNATDKHAVVYALDRESFNCGSGFARSPGITDDGINSTLNSQGPSAVAVPTYSSSKASFFTSAEEELANTLVATDYKDPPLVNIPEYIVRRLTPTECGRLQGFPDFWCSNLEIENPTEEDIAFWSEVFETHRKAMGKSTKPKSRNQIIKWLQNPHSDSAVYKMWGNGICLQCAEYVLSSIAYYTQKDM